MIVSILGNGRVLTGTSIRDIEHQLRWWHVSANRGGFKRGQLAAFVAKNRRVFNHEVRYVKEYCP